MIETILVKTTTRTGTVPIDDQKGINNIGPCWMKLRETAFIDVFGSAIHTMSSVIWTGILSEEIGETKRHGAS